MTYTISAENYTMPAVGRWDAFPEMHFRYAIRREDGSLCFRAETRMFADLILDRLLNPKEETR